MRTFLHGNKTVLGVFSGYLKKKTLRTSIFNGIEMYLNCALEKSCMNSNFLKYWPVS